MRVRTSNRDTMETINFNALTVKELQEYCRSHDIRPFSKKPRAELLMLIQTHTNPTPAAAAAAPTMTTAAVIKQVKLPQPIPLSRRYFKEPIVSKINHIFNTASRGYSTLGLGGNKHSVRALLEYTYFKKVYHTLFRTSATTDEQNVERMELLFPNGLVVVLVNTDLWDVKSSMDSIDAILLSRIGSDRLVSCVVLLESRTSASTDIKPLIQRLKTEYPTFQPLKLAHSSHISSPVRTSNANWSGHYAIHAKGGTQKTILEGNIHLGNPIYDYATDSTSTSLEYQMIYSMLCSIGAETLLLEQYRSSFNDIKAAYRAECVKRNLLDYEKYHLHPFNSKGELVCSIFSNPITAEQFLAKNDDCHSVQYCHYNGKKYDDVVVQDDHIVTTFRPYSIVWGHQWANYAQGDKTVDEIIALIKNSPRFQ